ncbi:MAG: hypothetical protein AB9891_14770 [Anaerolineaceae bacterium]
MTFDKRLLSDSAFDSFWNWIIGGVMDIIGIFAFFRPDLPFWSWPKFIEFLPWYGWLVIGFIIWLVGFASNVIKRLKEKQKKSFEQNKHKIIAIADGGIAQASGGNIINNFGPQEPNKNKKEDVSWQGVHFYNWNKRLSENAVAGGIIIENKKMSSIKQCHVEIKEIYDEKGFGLYRPMQRELPRSAGWEIDGIVSYDETDILIGKQKYLALIYSRWLMSGIPSTFFIGGKNGFQHLVSIGETYFIEIEIQGTIGDIYLKPKTKFVTIFFDGNKFSVEDISNNIPKTT